MGIFQILVLSVIIGSFAAYLYFQNLLRYWHKRGIPHDKPIFFHGNTKTLRQEKILGKRFYTVYQKYKGQAPFCGYYLLMRPVAILTDIELIRNVLIRDYTYFTSRNFYYNKRDDPLSAHLVYLENAEWKSMRNKMSPLFSSGKLKFIFPIVAKISTELVVALDKLLLPDAAEDTVVKITDILSHYTMDIIGNCVFGIKCNCLDNSDTEFRRMCMTITTKRKHKEVFNSLLRAYPNFFRFLGVCITFQEVADFYMGITRQTIAYYEKENIKSLDFMSLFVELKNSDDKEKSLTVEEIAAQAYIFFLAGYETSYITMSYCLYELALNQSIQDKVRAEIDSVLQQNNGSLNYESLPSLKYLHQILYETLRKYPVAGVLSRCATKDYKVPNSKYMIEKNTLVLIPVEVIHHDPDIYPNPEVFDPERFSPEEVAKRPPTSFLGFGDGPRNCIGLRFGEIEVMLGLAKLLTNFHFSPAKETQIPMKFNIKSFSLTPKDGISLNVTRRIKV